MVLAFLREQEMSYLAFSPSHDWQQDLIPYAKLITPKFVSLDRIILDANLERPTPRMIRNAIIRLDKLLALRQDMLIEIYAQERSLFNELEKILKAEIKTGKLGTEELEKFIDQIIYPAWEDLLCVLMRAKAYFNVARPFQYSPALTPPFFPAHPSFPSGHATQAYVVFLLVKDWRSALGIKLKPLAKKIGTNREIAGVHYSFDTAAGLALAKSFVVQFLKNSEIKQRMKLLRPK